MISLSDGHLSNQQEIVEMQFRVRKLDRIDVRVGRTPTMYVHGGGEAILNSPSRAFM